MMPAGSLSPSSLTELTFYIVVFASEKVAGIICGMLDNDDNPIIDVFIFRTV